MSSRAQYLAAFFAGSTASGCLALLALANLGVRLGSPFSCSGDAGYCQAALAEVRSEYQLEFYFGLLASLVVGVALFVFVLMVGWCLRKVRWA